MTTPVHLFVFGLGYTGSRFALAMQPDTAWTGGTVRNMDEALSLAAKGLRVSLFDATHAGIGVGEAIRQTTHLVMSIPPGEADPVLVWHRASILAAPYLQWIGYLSTIGVYGDHGGGWVDEATPPKPTSARSAARQEAEQGWQALADARHVPLAVFRLAGIYGPGRNALVNLADGTARRIVKQGQVFNRVHVDDIVAALSAALEKRAPGIFNLADDEPAPAEEVVAYAAELMGVPAPPKIPLDEAELSPMARSFYGESKRVRNRRIQSDLGLTLRYPTYREGLAALWRDGNWMG